ncbi:hypothetical protein Desor_2632 [Desulfosporosinus orientis DSM 765]|uniref:Uncharacterized protein n=1 Tax=Desulfosporosinus orientis (strain ATCC 19365 / DSM 765 / NCIMB 8382 / VKM B-1628 / Singapore I) TaxID=768706 RepID=G7W8X1_DESOD|nr:hypothetical protein Desor_2632 [Desulfosporosinus orientis DSM 765]
MLFKMHHEANETTKRDSIGNPVLTSKLKLLENNLNDA